MHQAFENRVAVGTNLYGFTVSADMDGRWSNPGHDVSATLANETEHVELGHQAFHHGEHRLIQRNVDHLAGATVDLAVTECHQPADDAPERGDRIADGNPGAHWWAVLEAGDIAQPAHGLADRAEARLITHRAALAEAGQANDDQTRVELVKRLGIQSELFQRSGAKVLDQHVRFSQQLLQDGQALCMLEIQRDGLLVARLHEPPQRGALVELAPLAQRVATLG